MRRKLRLISKPSLAGGCQKLSNGSGIAEQPADQSNPPRPGRSGGSFFPGGRRLG